MKAKKSTRGKPMNLYVRPDDVARITELVAYAANNGHLASPSMVVRAALRAVSANKTFLLALADVRSADLRFKGDI